MKKVYLLFISALLLFGSFGNAFAGVVREPVREVDSGTCGNELVWAFDGETGTLTIDGNGMMYNYSEDEPAPWYGKQITELAFGEYVDSIGSYAFRNCSGLTSVAVPGNITDIGYGAFECCSSLVSVSIPGSVRMIDCLVFSNCSSLSEVELNEGLQQIDGWAFMNCGALSSITLPSSLRTLGSGAFQDCSALTSVTIREGLNQIDFSAFKSCSSLSSIDLPNSLRSLGFGAFSDCTALTSITLPEGLNELQDGAFDSCYSLSEVYFMGPVPADCGIDIFSGCDPDLCIYYLPEYSSSWAPNGETEWQDWPLVQYGGDTPQVVSGTCGENLTWTLNTETGVLTISGTGDMYDYTYNDPAPWYELRAGVTEAVIEEGVTSIGAYAFRSLSSLVSVSIPSSCKSIGTFAFDYCSSLASADLPEGVESIGRFAFNLCYALSSVHIPASLTDLDYGVFFTCAGITEFTVASANPNYSAFEGVLFNKDMTELICCPCMREGEYYIPEGVETIDGDAFHGCRQLTFVYIPDTATDLGEWIFAECSSLQGVRFPEGITAMPNYTFYACGSLTSIAVPETVTMIGHGVFNNCSALVSVTLPDSVTYIGRTAFISCTALELNALPASLSTIDEYAFSGCRSIASLVIPSGVTKIGNNAFNGCTALADVFFMGDVPANAAANCFSSCSAELCLYYLAEHSSSWAPNGETTWNGYPLIEIGSDKCGDDLYWYFDESTGTLTIFGTGDMYNYADNIPAPWHDRAADITSIVVCEGVTSVGSDAFYECTSLTSVSLPVSLVLIGNFAFNFCSALETLNIPKCVTGFGAFSFQACTSLTEVNVDPENAVFASLDGVVFSKDMTELVFFPRGRGGEYTVPDGVTRIGTCAFETCTVTSVTLPEGLVEICVGAFRHCRQMTSINFPQGLTTIGAQAFFDCQRLNGLRIPASVTSIGANCFRYCYALRRMLFEGNPPSEVGADVFGRNYSDFTIYYRPPFEEGWSPNGETEWQGVPIFMCEPGDVDCDGYVTMADVTLLSMYLNGEQPAVSDRGLAGADPNLDACVDIRDIAAIYAMIANS